MLYDNLECFRYCSDLSGFDFVIILEKGACDGLTNKIDEIIEDWWNDVEGCSCTPLPEYIKDSLQEKHNIEISLYFSLEDE